MYVDGASPDAAYARWHQTIAAHVEEAMAGYPDAKGRYLAGLPPGEMFFVTIAARFNGIFRRCSSWSTRCTRAW